MRLNPRFKSMGTVVKWRHLPLWVPFIKSFFNCINEFKTAKIPPLESNYREQRSPTK